jgi:hypothetical protein
MSNRKHHSKNKKYPVPQLRVASINFFPKEGGTESNDIPANESKSPQSLPENKRSSNLPEFYEPRIKPKNFDPL